LESGGVSHRFESGYNRWMQYTVRGISAALDAALRKRARAAGKSLNEAAIEALAEGTGLIETPRKRRDLRDIDTNRYVDLCKGAVETMTLLEEAESVLMPFVVLGELRDRHFDHLPQLIRV
jgi:hypothetical protein